ncbi:proline racemase family protein [Burkholderia sp. AU30198]|nr:proline racemase family protein [Burkholderia sp. AU30198]
MMSNGNTISVATVLLKMCMLPMQEPVTEPTLEAPVGLIRITAECKDGKVKSVKFRNVPAFAAHRDALIDVPHLGKVRVDIGWRVICARNPGHK